MYLSFAVFPKAASFIKPAERSLHDLTSGQNRKLMQFIALNDFDIRPT
jgi:hypothetical protein